MDQTTTTPTFADEVASALAKLSGLPRWFQTAAWGRDLTPLGERVASVLGADVAEAENLRTTVKMDLLYQRRIEAKVARVRAIHTPADQYGFDCACCETTWPCPTIEALDGDA